MLIASRAPALLIAAASETFPLPSPSARLSCSHLEREVKYAQRQSRIPGASHSAYTIDAGR